MGMSAPLTIDTLRIKRATSGAHRTVVSLSLSNWKTLDVECSFNASEELIIKTVANALIEANQTTRQERLSRGLVETLIQIRKAVGRKNLNSVHLQRDMGLDKNEYNNAQKLRYHGLIAHDQDAGAGYWLITRLGAQFLNGQVSRPRSVTVRSNKVIDHDEVLVDVVEVMSGSAPRFDDILSYTPEPVVPMTYTQVAML